MSKKLTVNKLNVHLKKVIKTETSVIKVKNSFYFTGGVFGSSRQFVDIKDINQISLSQWIDKYFELKREHIFVTK